MLNVVGVEKPYLEHGNESSLFDISTVMTFDNTYDWPVGCLTPTVCPNCQQFFSYNEPIMVD